MIPNPVTIGTPAAARLRSPVLPLASAMDPAECGNKACHLARVAGLGLPVPSGVVITNGALEAFLRAGCMHQPIAELCGGLTSGSAAGAAAAADAFRARLLAQRVPERLRSEIEIGVRALGPGPFMVRSSAHGEDACSASFAGQLESIADVGTDGGLIEAVVRVWASRWSHRALAYGNARGATLRGMGVIVQRQVASRWSGVLFTEAPDDHAQMLLEFCSGMGEALVSGRTNPGRITIARHDLRWSLVAGPEGWTESSDSWVDSLRVDQIARAGMAIERGSGGAQDIEWAVDRENHLWIVQARPITVRRAAGAARATPNPLTGDSRIVCWSNANVNENFPDPVTPAALLHRQRRATTTTSGTWASPSACRAAGSTRWNSRCGTSSACTAGACTTT